MITIMILMVLGILGTVMMADSLRMESETWSASGLSTQKLDDSKNLKTMHLEFDATFNTSTTPVPGRDGYAADLLFSSLVLRDGSNQILKVYGRDVHLIAQLMNAIPHGMSAIGTTGSQTGVLGESKFYLPLEIPGGAYANPILEINWNPATGGAHADYTVTAGSMNGTYFHCDGPVTPYKLMADITNTNKTSTVNVDIPAEKLRLTQILIITRAYATPYALRNALTTVQTVIDGEYNDYDADTLRSEYSMASKQAEATGVYLIRLSKKPIVSNNASKVICNGDGTATDYSVYFFYVGVENASPLEDKPVGVASSGGGSAAAHGLGGLAVLRPRPGSAGASTLATTMVNPFRQLARRFRR